MKPIRITVVLASGLLLTGCMSSITPAGPGLYYLSKGPLPIWSSAARAKADCYRQANAWCVKRGLIMVPITSVADDSFVGHAGSAELTFRALKPGDTNIQPATIEVPAPTERIEQR